LSLVLDCSAALAFLLPDETTPGAGQVLDTIVEYGAWVPGHWRLEVANALKSAVRRKRISRAFRNEALADLSQLNIRVDAETDRAAWGETLLLTDRFGLTPYDAVYLELAQRRNLPLATLDAELRFAAGTAGVSLLGV
jgi:predicted nucleic acid-binding protein